MKKTILQLTAALFLLIFAGCKADEIVENGSRPVDGKEGSIFTLEVEMPEDEQQPGDAGVTTKLSLTEEADKVVLAWEANDEIYLAFVQGEGESAVAVGDTVSVTKVTNSGKTAEFQFELPQGIDPSADFKLYGVYGGEGLNADAPTLAKLPANPGEGTSLNDKRIRENVMLYFQSEVPTGTSNVTVEFHHVGSLFKIRVKNSSTAPLTNITGARLVGQEATNTEWAYNNAGGGEFNLVSGAFTEAGTAGNQIFFTSPVSVVNGGETVDFWAWYPPHPDKVWPELKLELVNGSGDAFQVTTNSKPSRNEATAAGRAFRFYTVWNGSVLQFSDASLSVPEKTPFGIRPESAELMFAKQLNADLGIIDGFTTGIALSGDYLVINSRGHNSVYIDAKTGEKIGEIDLGEFKGANKNFYHTSDQDGNILISNLTPGDGSTFKISKLSSVNSTPEPFITWTPDPAVPLGRKFSINGSILSDAIITAPLNPSSRTTQFARWQVTGGSLVSQTPDIITVAIPVGAHLSDPYTSPQSGRGWDTNVDIISSSSTLPNAHYFTIYYGDDQLSWVDGNSNTQSSFLHLGRTGFIGSAVDYIEFNNAKYLAATFANGGTSGTGDIAWILDANDESKFNLTSLNQGNLNAANSPAIVWEGPRGEYGATKISAPANNVYGVDVLFKPSDDGYYLYLYFVFNNGFVVGYQFDCIEM